MSDSFVVPVAPLVSLPIGGDPEARFPVRRIYCVGRNYADHIKEMGGDVREPPFFFQKPTDAVRGPNAEIPYPSRTSDFQHEVELVLAIGKGGKNITVEAAAEHVWGIGVGIDLTRRDLQVAARKAGRPWEIGKSFDASAPCSSIVPLNGGSLPIAGAIELKVNGSVRQTGDIAQMIWNCAEVVSKLSEDYALVPGDLIMTGTPAGVGPVVSGDLLEANLQGWGSVAVRIAPA